MKRHQILNAFNRFDTSTHIRLRGSAVQILILLKYKGPMGISKFPQGHNRYYINIRPSPAPTITFRFSYQIAFSTHFRRRKSQQFLFSLLSLSLFVYIYISLCIFPLSSVPSNGAEYERPTANFYRWRP